MSKKHIIDGAGDVFQLAMGAAKASTRRAAECEQEDQLLTLDRARRGAHLSDEKLRARSVLELDARLALLRATPAAPGVGDIIRKLEAKRRVLLRRT